MVLNQTTRQLNKFFEVMSSKKKHTGIAFLDIAKALHKVWHDGLLYKLKCLNTPTVIFNINRSFLFSRSITVQIDGTNSDTKQINAGVPQGSKLQYFSTYTYSTSPVQRTRK